MFLKITASELKMPSQTSCWLIVLSIFVLLVSASSETCQYQFSVHGDAASIAKCPSFDEETGRKVNDMENEMYMSRERIKSVAETFGKEISKLENETKSLTDLATDLKSDLSVIQVSLTKLNKIEDEVVRLRNLVIGTNESLTPKYANLQEKMLDIVRDFQKQMTAQMSSFRSIFLKTEATEQTLTQNKVRLSNVERSIGILETLPIKVEGLSVQEEAQQADIASLRGQVSDGQKQTTLLTASVESMKDRVSNMQIQLSYLTNISSNIPTGDVDARISAIEDWQNEMAEIGPSLPAFSKKMQEMEGNIGNINSEIAGNKEQIRQMYTVNDKKFDGLIKRLENMGRDIERLKREAGI